MITRSRAEHDFGRAPRGQVGRIRHRQHGAAVGRLIGKHQHFAQETLRERRHQRRGRQHLLQRDTLQSEEARRLVGEFAGRQIGDFPESCLDGDPGSSRLHRGGPALALARTLRRESSCFDRRCVQEQRRLMTGHACFQSQSTGLLTSPHQRVPARMVIDPECDNRRSAVTPR